MAMGSEFLHTHISWWDY